ncbi:MAG: hypothetical protein FJZ01_13335 [Candidatus Sericytochromatia bacterium]|nr:hypothetical protein [Candidatus Tanganyikabacteria bacterium]
MLPLREILLQSGRLLRRHPGLLLPVIAVALGERLLQPGKEFSAPILVGLLLLSLAVHSGLLSMIRSAHNSEMGAWDAFLIGVGRYFAPILAGSMVQFALVFLTLLPIVAWLRASVGIPDLKALKTYIDAQQVPPPALAEPLIQWTAAICAWAAVWGIVFFFLALWQQFVAAQSLSWLRAWQASAAFVRSHWLRMTGLLALQALSLGLGFALLSTRTVLAAEIGGVALVLVNCYFTVATMLAIMGPAAEPKGENVDATA